MQNLETALPLTWVQGDGGPGFDGVWAANSPNLQEDFAWRHNHVITIAAKAITTKFYGEPIARSSMSGCSKGGHGVLMEAQRFPEDFEGLLAIAPVYDLIGRVMAGAWTRRPSAMTIKGRF